MEEECVPKQIMELEMSILGLQRDVTAAFQRIEEQTRLIKSIHELTLSVHDHKSELRKLHIQQEVMRAQLETIKSKPAKHWNLLIGSGISAIIGALIGTLAGG